MKISRSRVQVSSLAGGVPPPRGVQGVEAPRRGEMAEWLKAVALKATEPQKGSMGSNPLFSSRDTTVVLNGGSTPLQRRPGRGGGEPGMDMEPEAFRWGSAGRGRERGPFGAALGTLQSLPRGSPSRSPRGSPSRSPRGHPLEKALSWPVVSQAPGRCWGTTGHQPYYTPLSTL